MKYKVFVPFSGYLATEVEASNELEAEKLAIRDFYVLEFKEESLIGDSYVSWNVDNPKISVENVEIYVKKVDC